MRWLILAVFLSSCYGLKKATVQHGRAVATFPELGAVFCADKYPCLPGLVTSDTVTAYDTLWGLEVYNDTLKVHDTIHLTKRLVTERLVTKTVTIRDTIQIKDRAELKACEIIRDKAVSNLSEATGEIKKYKARSRNYLWIIIALAALNLLQGYSKIRSFLKL